MSSPYDACVHLIRVQWESAVGQLHRLGIRVDVQHSVSLFQTPFALILGLSFALSLLPLLAARGTATRLAAAAGYLLSAAVHLAILFNGSGFVLLPLLALFDALLFGAGAAMGVRLLIDQGELGTPLTAGAIVSSGCGAFVFGALLLFAVLLWAGT